MSLLAYLSQSYVLLALASVVLVGLICGLVGPFVASRDMAFAVHGSAELSFTGAAAGLLIANDALSGALVGSVVVAAAIGLLGDRATERNTVIGVILAFGLGLGIFLLSFYKGFADEATNILFGQLFLAGPADILLLAGIALAIAVVIAVIYRPLLFASVDPDVAAARGVRTRAVGLIFVVLLAFTVTEASQVVGTLLVLSLAITPAAAARRLSASPLRVTGLSVAFSVIAAVGGLVLSLTFPTIKASFFISSLSFLVYLLARALGGTRQRRLRRPPARA